MPEREAQARVRIDRELERAGWRFFDEENGRQSVILESRVPLSAPLWYASLGDDFEHAPHGFVDYLLTNEERRPVALVEAKRQHTDPLEAKEQARAYASHWAFVTSFSRTDYFTTTGT